MMESKQNEVDLEQALLTWRNWSGEKVNNQNKWVFRIIFGLLAISITFNKNKYRHDDNIYYNN